MVCHLCKKPSSFTLSTSNLNYCKSCFARLIERRVKRHIRKNYMIKKDESLYITDPLCEHMIKVILKGMPINITKHKKKAAKTVLLHTLEDEAHSFLERLFHGKDLKLKQDQDKIKLFTPIMEEELIHYAKLKNIVYKKRKKDHIDIFLDNIEKKHPSTKNSLLRSISSMHEILR